MKARFHGYAVRSLALLALVAFSTSSALATEPEVWTMSDYADEVDVPGLIAQGGVLMAAVVVAATVVTLAFKVIRSGMKWFRA